MSQPRGISNRLPQPTGTDVRDWDRVQHAALVEQFADDQMRIGAIEETLGLTPKRARSGYAPTPLTTKGDLWTRTSSVDARLAVGADGSVLQSDSAATTGLSWSTYTGTGGVVRANSPTIDAPTITGTATMSTVIAGSVRVGGAGGTHTVDIAGTFGATGTATIGGATTIGGTLGVTGAATLNSTLAVTGAATTNGITNTGNTQTTTLNTTGAATLGSTLGVTGAATVGGTLGVTGTLTGAAANFAGSVSVTGGGNTLTVSSHIKASFGRLESGTSGAGSGSGSVKLNGDTSGSATITAPAVAGTSVLTLPVVAADTLVARTTTETLTNKTFDSSSNGYRVANLADSAWTAYTPTATAGSGTFTTVSATGKYKDVGNTRFIEMVVTITAFGTAGGYVRVTFPAASAKNAVVSGVQVGTNATLGGRNVTTAGVDVYRYDAASVAGTNDTLLIHVRHEI